MSRTLFQSQAPIDQASPNAWPALMSSHADDVRIALVFGQAMATVVATANEIRLLETELVGHLSAVRRSAEAVRSVDQHLNLFARTLVASLENLLVVVSDHTTDKSATETITLSDEYLIFGQTSLRAINDMLSAYLAIVELHFDAEAKPIFTGNLSPTAQQQALRDLLSDAELKTTQIPPQTPSLRSLIVSPLTRMVKPVRRSVLALAKRQERPIARLACQTGLVRWIPDLAIQAAILTREAQRRARQKNFSDASRLYARTLELGSSFNLPQYEIAAGALELFQLLSPEASPMLASGFSNPICKVLNRSKACSVPSHHADWLTENQSNFKDPEFWQQAYDEAKSSEAMADQFRQRLALLVHLSGEDLTASAMFTEQRRLTRSNDQARNGDLFALWSNDWVTNPPTGLSAATVTAADADRALVADLIMSASRDADLTLNQFSIPAATSDHLRSILKQPLLQPLIEALRAMQIKDYRAAMRAAQPVLDIYTTQIRSLERKPSIRKIFLSGFGWSGSSAVHDALTGYPGVFEMPGAGEMAYINAGAGNEPVYLQGPSGLGALWADAKSRNGLSQSKLWSFFKLYVLATEPVSYDEYKAVHATRALQDRLGDLYFVLILDFIANLAEDLDRCQDAPRPSQISATPFQRFTTLLVAALTGPTDRFALFNNAIFVHAASTIELVTDATLVAVGRDVRDQFSDQKRNNLYFSQKPHGFVARNRRLRRNISTVFDGLTKTRPDITYRYVQFERFVLDAAYRVNVVKSLIKRYDPVLESDHFDPNQSARNIGGHAAHLSPEELATLTASELVFDASDLAAKYVEGNSPAQPAEALAA